MSGRQIWINRWGPFERRASSRQLGRRPVRVSTWTAQCTMRHAKNSGKQGPQLPLRRPAFALWLLCSYATASVGRRSRLLAAPRAADKGHLCLCLGRPKCSVQCSVQCAVQSAVCAADCLQWAGRRIPFQVGRVAKWPNAVQCSRMQFTAV